MLLDQVAYLDSKQAEVVCLQEVTPGTVRALQAGLREVGFEHFAHTVSPGLSTRGPRRYGLLVASRSSVTPTSIKEVPWPERVLGVETVFAGSSCTILTTHIPPGSSNGWVKADMLEAVATVAATTTGMRIVCGDFNCPKEERTDGSVITWAQTVRATGAVRIRRGYDRWDAAERGIIEGLPSIGLVDVPRMLNGGDAEMYSYFDIRKQRVTASRRYDHLFASSDFKPVACEYDDVPRAMGLSDHAPLWVDFASD